VGIETFCLRIITSCISADGRTSVISVQLELYFVRDVLSGRNSCFTSHYAVVELSDRPYNMG